MLDPQPARVPYDVPDPDEQESVSTLVSRLVAESRALASAEVEVYKAKAGERVAAYKSAAIFLGAAAVLALSAITALLVGLIMTLATLVGPGSATAIVIVSVFAIAGILALVGKRRLTPAKPEPVR